MNYNNIQPIPALEVVIDYPIDEVKKAMDIVYSLSFRNGYTAKSKNFDFGIYKFIYSGGARFGVIMTADVTVTISTVSDDKTKVNINSLNTSGTFNSNVNIASRFINERQNGFLNGLSVALRGKPELTISDFNNLEESNKKSSGCMVILLLGLAPLLYYFIK